NTLWIEQKIQIHAFSPLYSDVPSCCVMWGFYIYKIFQRMKFLIPSGQGLKNNEYQQGKRLYSRTLKNLLER
ncbi:hypothetical protein DRN44_06890, partial [Thermococci archaeon]